MEYALSGVWVLALLAEGNHPLWRELDVIIAAAARRLYKRFLTPQPFAQPPGDAAQKGPGLSPTNTHCIASPCAPRLFYTRVGGEIFSRLRSTPCWTPKSKCGFPSKG